MIRKLIASSFLIDLISDYLDNPICELYQKIWKHPLNQAMIMYLITFLGNCFIQGYRILQKIDKNIIILHNFTYNTQNIKQKNNKSSSYKIIYFTNDFLFQSNQRKKIFHQLKNISLQLSESIEINLLFLKRQSYSILTLNQLDSSKHPESTKFFKFNQILSNKNGFDNINKKQQGIRLHMIIQYFLKGASQFHNTQIFKNQIFGQESEIKFTYDLEKLINTIIYIIGRQIIQNDYTILTSQKWMRKSTQKTYKRFDLILRNISQTCIIDWKFSQIDANIKIKTNYFIKKNQLYYQLANKDYRSKIILKFYCIHKENYMKNYVKFTSAKYDYKIEEVEIDRRFYCNKGEQNEDINAQEYTMQEIMKIKEMKKQRNGFFQNNSGKNNNLYLNKFMQSYHLNKKNRIVQNKQKSQQNNDQQKDISYEKQIILEQTIQQITIIQQIIQTTQTTQTSIKKKKKKMKHKFKPKQYILILNSQQEQYD